MGLQIAHDVARNHFATTIDGQHAVLEYRREDGRVMLDSVQVPKPIERRGIGSALTKAALDWARGEGLQVVPNCPFVRTFIDEHPEYRAQLERGDYR